MKMILTLLLTLLPVVALAQPVDPYQHQDAYAAPGRTIFNGDVVCKATGPTFLMFDQGQTGADDHFLVPDGSRVVVTSLLAATSTTTGKCGLFDTHKAWIDDPASATVDNDILDVTGAPNGTRVQGGLLLVQAGQTNVMRASYLLGLGLGGARSGLCAAPVKGSTTDAQSYTAATDRVRVDGLDVYASCKCDEGTTADSTGACASQECDNVAGTPANTQCLVTQAARSTELAASRRAGATLTLRGQHFGCRCSGRQTLHVQVVR